VAAIVLVAGSNFVTIPWDASTVQTNPPPTARDEGPRDVLFRGIVLEAIPEVGVLRELRR
jgi:hypothetical protein